MKQYRLVFNGYRYRIEYLAKKFFSRKPVWKYYSYYIGPECCKSVFETKDKEEAEREIESIKKYEDEKTKRYKEV